MKTLLPFFLLLFATVSNAQTVNIPDPEFKNILVNYQIHFGYTIDANDDDEIQYSEAAAMTGTLNVSGATLGGGNGNIQDLTGIEAFINITGLFCDTNQLTSLDLSQNTALEILRCENNLLASINITQNTALKELHCYQNQIASLNVSQNIALEKLYCNENQLANLNIDQNIALKELYCHTNQILSLNLSQNSNLEIFIGGNNQLTSLDMSQNVNLTYLVAVGNQLVHLDLRNGNNSSITYFSSENNSNLTCIFVDDASYSNNHPNWHKDSNSTYVETQTECDAITTVEDFLFQQIKLYPNPVKDKLFIDAIIPIRTVEILNLNGKKIKSFDFSNKREINLPQLPSGIYFLKFYNKSKQILTTKIIKL